MGTKEEYIPFGEDHPGALKICERLPFLLILKWAQENGKTYAQTIREMFEEYELYPFEDKAELEEFDEAEVNLYFTTKGHDLLNDRGPTWIVNPLQNTVLTALPKDRPQDISFPFESGNISFIVGEGFVKRLNEHAKTESVTTTEFVRKVATVYDIRRTAA